MKILIIDTIHPKLISLLKENKINIDEDYTSSKKEIEKKIHFYQGIIIRSRFKIDKEFIEIGNKLKFIARVGAGLENINTKFAREKGIKIISSPEGNSQAVGEHTLGMLLSLTKNISKSNTEIKKNIWEREKNRGFEVSNKTVGIIGYGNMGKSFAKCISGIGANVVSYDIKENYADNYTKEVSLEYIYNNADIVSIHTPLTDITNQMCNDNFFQNFKKSIYFLNTARGKIVNTLDLVKKYNL